MGEGLRRDVALLLPLEKCPCDTSLLVASLLFPEVFGVERPASERRHGKRGPSDPIPTSLFSNDSAIVVLSRITRTFLILQSIIDVL